VAALFVLTDQPSNTSHDRITDPTGLAAKVVGVRDWWARSGRARTADRRRGGATLLLLKEGDG
jgi:hypothetical protein